MAENDNKSALYKPVGVSGLRRDSAYIYEDFLPHLRWPQAGKVYQEMADNDAVVGAVLYLAEMLIRGVSWEVEPGGKSDVDTEAAKFLYECMHDMDESWASFISEVLSMLTYGFSFHEVVYKVRRGPDERNPKYRSAYSDGRIGWRRMPTRAQTSLKEWEFNEEGDVTAFIQQCEPDWKIARIPMSKGLLFRTRVSKDNPEGKSLLRNAYRSFFFKKHFEEIEGIGIERDLAGFPVLTAPENMDLWNDEDPSMVRLRADAEALVASVRRDSEEGILLPFGWDLRLLTSGSSRQIDIGSTIERYDVRIAMTMLSDILMLGTGAAGSYALSQTKESLLASALQAQISNIADVLNAKAVRALFNANAGSFPGLVELPRIVPSRIKTPSLSEVSLMLRAMNVSIAGDMELQNHLRYLLNMPQLDQETFDKVYAPQMPGQAFGEGVDELDGAVDSNEGDVIEGNNDLDDSNDKLFEQNADKYTGERL